MKKPKGFPVEEEGGEGTADGLELLSIGSLYSGPWDKKYWSSSRGKDRYPYPVGYQAIRAHDGIRCKIEIHEGSKGPLFMITTPGGSSFCGQTPNMAWERFQKKGFPHMKIWHGKRFTCNIDCPEFFGFKNPLVQRLLRELVASIGGTAEQRHLSSSFCDMNLEVKHEKELQSAVSHPDLLSCLAYPKFCRKRSFRPVNRRTVLNYGLGFKRSDQVLESGKFRRNSEPSIHIDDPTDNNVTNMITYPVGHDEKKLKIPSNCETVGIDCGASSDPNKLDRFRESEKHVFRSSTAVEYESLQLTDLEDSECKYGVGIEICVPDTYESLPVNACDHELKDCMGLTSGTQDMASTSQKCICGISPAEPQKEEIAFDSSNGSSEKIDFDSVGEDIAKSMISLLLPRAIPLLTYTSRKKRKKINKKFDASSDATLTSHGDGKMISTSINSVVSPEAGMLRKLTTPSSHVNFDRTEAVASSSLDVDKCGSQDAIDLHLNGKGESKVPTPQNTVCEMLNEEDMNALNSIVEELMEQDSNQTGCPVSKENNCRSSPVPEDSNKLHAPSMTDEKKLLGNSGNHVDHDSEQNHESAGSFWDHTTLNFTQEYVSQEGMHEYSAQIDVGDIQFKMLPENASEAEVIAALSCSNIISRGSNYHFGENSKFSGSMPGTFIDLIGCYNHPRPVLSVLLSPSEDHVNLCVVCGLHIDSQKTLFFYKVSTEKPKMGCPSFVGHTLAVFPSFGSLCSTAVERSCLEFTPSGRNLVMLGSIKVPYCRKNDITCSCSICASVPFTENAIRVVQVNFGYVAVLLELKSFDRIVSVLVCEPDYLVALGESGRMQVWLMNQSWSVPEEEFNLPSRDCLSSLVELQKIPQFPYWVVGFSGFSEFTLWDISKRTCISKFSCLDHSIRHFIPVNSIRWHLGPVSVKEDVQELVDQLAYGKVPDFRQESPYQGNEESIAVWLLVATEPDPYEAYSCQKDANASWRLALLAKSAVIMGSVIDSKATSMGALSGHGIIGTVDGSVYTWEFSTGTKLFSLHHLQGERVSCIATAGDSNSGILAASGEGGKLVIYRIQIEGK
ncbi:hypothetical protein MLD38_037963 [Melastoma candidum]|uniref:Uncharacterized protein n=1 Tax=Melastoma candidum TaxID=119954 RepID=A0ACB9KYK6_9MYRT|nr:hypothetical protein MLD38_037963 [Melastoma candidum]